MKFMMVLFFLFCLAGCATVQSIDVADWATPDAVSFNYGESTGDFYSRTYFVGLTWFVPQPSQLRKKSADAVHGTRRGRFHPGRLPSGLPQPLVIEDDGFAVLRSNDEWP